MPLFALTPDLVASIAASYPDLTALNLADNGAAPAAPPALPKAL